MLPEKELLEAVDLLEALLHGGLVRPARTALYTLGEVLNDLPNNHAIAQRILGIVMTGVSHYDSEIHQGSPDGPVQRDLRQPAHQHGLPP